MLCLGWFGTPVQRRPDLGELGSKIWSGDWSLDALWSAKASADQELDPAPAVWIDPAALEWQLEEACDPRWAEELSMRMDELEAFSVDDELSFLDLVSCLESLSFVFKVHYTQPDAERGCDLELELREPVACVPSDGLFYAIDAEGVLLSGSWEMPPYCDGLPLPVVGPMADGAQLMSRARPGDWLIEQEHLDALELALSMQEHLSASARSAMGRLVIDATQARSASVSNPGIKLLLGGRRLVLFGRPADSDEPGELAVERKWASLESCLLGANASSYGGWALLDLRWDHAELDIEPLLLAKADGPPGPGRGRTSPAHDPRTPAAATRVSSNPRVR